MDVWHADGITDTQPIVLNAGEGIAAVNRGSGVSISHHWMVVLKNPVSNKVYVYQCDAGSGIEGDVIWSFMNESASSNSIQVYIIRMPDFGESNMPRFRISRIAGIKDGTRITRTVATHDTATTVPEVSAIEGPFVAFLADGLDDNIQTYAGSPIPIASAQRVGTIRNFMLGHILTLTHSAQMHGGALGYAASEYEVWPGERRYGAQFNDDTIVLSPGQGLAVIGGGNGLIETSEQAYLTIEIVGYVDSKRSVRTTYALGA
jgi:hypothetical protein